MKNFKIKHKTDSTRILFEATAESLVKVVEKAVAEGADLTDADLRGANLREADLRGAYV